MTVLKQEFTRSLSIAGASLPKNPQSLLKDIRVLLESSHSNLMYQRVLKSLQVMQFLPTQESELKMAIKLLKECDNFCSTFLYLETEDFPDLLLLTTIFDGQKMGWRTLYERYISLKHTDPQEIKNAIMDYLKSVFFPQIFRSIERLDSENPFHQILFRTWHPASDYAKWLTNHSPLFEIGALILCRGKNIVDLAALSDNWHAPLQQTAFYSFKSFTTSDWPSLFQTEEESSRQETHKELKIPDSIVDKKNYKFIALTSYDELVDEGMYFIHCVRKRVSACQLENMHVLSLACGETRLSTLALKVDCEKHCVTSFEHESFSHSSPLEEDIRARNWLTESLDNGTLFIDFDHLERERQKRVNATQQNFENKITCFIGFNPFGPEGLKEMSKIRRRYLAHTSPDFKANLQHLMQLETITLNYRFFKNIYTLEIDLLNPEERARRKSKKDREKIRAWEWSLSQKLEEKGNKKSDEKVELGGSKVFSFDS